MAWESAMEAIIGASIAIAGFSGIVAAVGRSDARTWTAGKQIALEILLAASGSTVLFAFLPYVLADLVEEARMWRWLSALVMLFHIAIALYRNRQLRMVGVHFRTINRNWRFAFLAVGGSRLACLFANVFWFANSSFYIAALVLGAATGFLAFTSLLLESGIVAGAAAGRDE